MRKRSSRKKKEDFNERAADILKHATDEEPEKESEPKTDDGKDPAAVALGRKGGLKGGKARAKNMTPKERSEAARKAAKARWNKKQSNK
jgi:hypothetical protein